MPNGIKSARLSNSYTVAAPGANTDILATALTPLWDASTFYVYAVLATTSVLNYTETDGTTLYTVGLNKSVGLGSGDGYLFKFPTVKGNSYNFQVETDGIIQVMRVTEVVE